MQQQTLIRDVRGRPLRVGALGLLATGAHQQASIRHTRGRWRTVIGSVTGSLAGLVLLFAPAVAQATEVLDQSQTTTENQFGFAGAAWRGQTFTAGQAGSLDRVDLDLAIAGNVTQPLTVGIYASSGGVPTGSALGSGTVSAAGLQQAPSFTWTPVPISPPVAITSGQQYAIVASSPNQVNPLSNAWVWAIACAPNPYAGGTSVESSNSGSSWSPDSLCSTAFKTYVDVGPDFADLIADSQGVGPGTSLVDKATSAQASFNAGNTVDACTTLNAYVYEVNAQTGQSITSSQATDLIADAKEIEAAIPCT